MSILKALTIGQIVDREAHKTQKERLDELTTPPKTVGGVVGTAAGALLLRDLGIPGMIAGGVLGNFAVNSLSDDLNDPGKLQRSADRDFSQSVDGWLAGTSKLHVDDAVHLTESALDGVGLVNSVKHRHDPDWHPGLEPLFVDQETQAALADAGVDREVGDQLYATDAVSTLRGSYREHWWQLWKKRAPYTV